MPGANTQTSLSPLATKNIEMGKLLTHSQIGLDFLTADFCRVYDLHEDILTHLRENGYHKAKTFKYITVSQLHEMSFKYSEIASLQDAVDEWAQAAM
ncbi:hypothetical protein C0992_002675 [Termitomyces sp. T32_za158]|nr:hypothetical protein C0992_002675 [Termitomyces sp. T32_za158]